METWLPFEKKNIVKAFKHPKAVGQKKVEVTEVTTSTKDSRLVEEVALISVKNSERQRW